MDEGYHLLSHLPTVANHKIEACEVANDERVAAIRANPHRFAGLAALPTASSREANVELERAIEELRFRGAMIE